VSDSTGGRIFEPAISSCTVFKAIKASTCMDAAQHNVIQATADQEPRMQREGFHGNRKHDTGSMGMVQSTAQRLDAVSHKMNELAEENTHAWSGGRRPQQDLS
jgi:hypothetical protein